MLYENSIIKSWNVKEEGYNIRCRICGTVKNKKEFVRGSHRICIDCLNKNCKIHGNDSSQNEFLKNTISCVENN